MDGPLVTCLAVAGALALFLVAAVAVFYSVDCMCRLRRGKFQLEGRVVLITGAAGGIGQALAIQLARQRCNLVLWDLRGEALNRVAVRCRQELSRSAGDRQAFVTTNVVDVSDASAVDRAFKSLKERLCCPQCGRLRVSVIVNNCGIVFGKSLRELTAQQMQRTLSVNVFGPMWILHKFVPMLVSAASGAVGSCSCKNDLTEACIVNMSSMMGLLGAAGLTDYCASKWAINGMHESLRQELAAASASSSIHTLLVAPYLVNTGMFDGAMANDSVYWWHKLLFPALQPEEVALAIVHAVQSRRRLLVLPRQLSLVPTLLHLLPSPMYDFVVSLTGGKTGLRHFTGRHPSWNFPRPPPQQSETVDEDQ
eukprot:INCI18046.5.p1 GENE.INCI18046.5~~INCI18046.5.p1  ORF type:complete len:366 (+),score=41.66 INCI18046.5:224-1321(+)